LAFPRDYAGLSCSAYVALVYVDMIKFIFILVRRDSAVPLPNPTERPNVGEFIEFILDRFRGPAAIVCISPPSQGCR
jgi:hypothetical protein